MFGIKQVFCFIAELVVFFIIMHAKVSIYDYLKDDHKRVVELVDKILSSTQESQQREAFRIAREEILVHSKAEEKVFYRPLEEHQSIKKDMCHLEDDHNQIEKQLTILTVLPQGKKWNEEVEELKKILEHHIRHEEDVIFPKAEKIFTDQWALEKVQEMEERKEKVRRVSGKIKDFNEKWDAFCEQAKDFFTDLKDKIKDKTHKDDHKNDSSNNSKDHHNDDKDHKKDHSSQLHKTHSITVDYKEHKNADKEDENNHSHKTHDAVLADHKDGHKNGSSDDNKSHKEKHTDQKDHKTDSNGSDHKDHKNK